MINLKQSLLAFAVLVAASHVEAGSLEQAKRIHDRLAGVPPSNEVLLDMADSIDAGDYLEAARTAMENDGFYNVTLKNWVAPWTNREFDVFVPLNDYIATVIGIARDDIDYRQVLYGDILYVGEGIPGFNTEYSVNNNTHYEEIEAEGYSLQSYLVQKVQSAVVPELEGAASGVVTTRAGAKSFLIAGTNRAAFRFTLVNHLCMDLEQVHDTSGVPDRIRQDVSRSPGGDSRVFLNNCIGCHIGMDPMTQGLAYYDYSYDVDNDPSGESGSIEYNSVSDIDPETGSRVQPKYYNNDKTFTPGYRTPDDSWENYWREGQNTALGWDDSLAGKGQGASTMMQELAHSEAFASCAVQKVFKAVCLREAQDNTDLTKLTAMQSNFVSGGHKIKDVFAEAAVYCAGEDE